jgi:hypothetical protein
MTNEWTDLGVDLANVLMINQNKNLKIFFRLLTSSLSCIIAGLLPSSGSPVLPIVQAGNTDSTGKHRTTYYLLLLTDSDQLF